MKHFESKKQRNKEANNQKPIRLKGIHERKITMTAKTAKARKPRKTEMHGKETEKQGKKKIINKTHQRKFRPKKKLKNRRSSKKDAS